MILVVESRALYVSLGWQNMLNSREIHSMESSNNIHQKGCCVKKKNTRSSYRKNERQKQEPHRRYSRDQHDDKGERQNRIDMGWRIYPPLSNN
jgi:hypothetical protein